MLSTLRGRTGWRRALVALALLALALKAMVPSGFMPGSSLAAPIVLCPDQGPMPGMAMTMTMAARAGHHAPDGTRHDAADHPCAFAGLGLAALAAPLDGPVVAPVAIRSAVAAMPGRAFVPGRGLAAPPPPSHAPPADRA